MENKKSGVLIGLVIGLLIGIIAGLCVYIVMDKKDDKVDNDNKKQTEEKVNNNDKKEDETFKEYDYTAKHQITCNKKSASDGNVLEEYGVSSGKVNIDTSKYTNIFSYIADQDNIQVIVNYFEENNGDYVEKQKELTKDETNTFINNMKKSTVSLKAGGLGGILTPYIIVKYSKNGEEHMLNIYDNISISCATDINIFKIIDDNLVETDDQAINYIINGFDDSIYDFLNRN